MVRFEVAKISLHVKLPNLRAAKLKGSTVLSSLPAGGGGLASSANGGQYPVYYAALVSWGGWCKVTVSFLLPPLNILQYCRRSRARAS